MKKHIPITTDPRLAHLRDAMAALQGAGLDVVLAGGAPRDLLLHRTPRDFDVFVYVTDYCLVGRSTSQWTVGTTANAVRVACLATSALLDAGFTKVKMRPNYCSRRRGVLAVLEIAHDIEVILTDNSPRRLLATFDTPLCEAIAEFQEDSLVVTSTTLFDAFVRGRILGFLPDDSGNGWQRLKVEGDHINRLAKAFPDFTPVLLSKGRVCISDGDIPI